MDTPQKKASAKNRTREGTFAILLGASIVLMVVLLAALPSRGEGCPLWVTNVVTADVLTLNAPDIPTSVETTLTDAITPEESLLLLFGVGLLGGAVLLRWAWKMVNRPAPVRNHKPSSSKEHATCD
jgi:hypothetical protein